MEKYNTPCHCGSHSPYQNCCGPFLSGKSVPFTPEQLMRSRYSGFCTQNIEYLLATRHPSKQLAGDRETLAKTLQQTQWLGLRVLNTRMDSIETGRGYVEFAAVYQTGNEIGQLHEESIFVRENTQWYYLDGKLLEPLKFGRNEPCWCGSNKKIKKCHGK